MTEFFDAHENNLGYKDVCIRDKSGNNVKEAFKSLRCSGEKLHEWEADAKDYVRRFTRGKQCMQRRLTNMKKYGAKTNELETARKKHAYPIAVAYTYAKDCVRKIGTRKNARSFEESTNKLIEKLAATQTNIASTFNGGIEASAAANPELSEILNKPYYTSEQWDTIDRFREDPMSPEAQAAYDSIIDADLEAEGYVRNNTGGPNIDTEVSNNVAINAAAATASTTTFKPARTRRIRKKAKPAPIPRRNFNVSELPTPIPVDERMKYKAVIENWEKYMFIKMYEDFFGACMKNLKYANEILDDFLPKVIFGEIRTRVDSLKRKNNRLIDIITPRLKYLINERIKIYNLVKKSMTETSVSKEKRFFYYIFEDLHIINEYRVNNLSKNDFNSLAEQMFAVFSYNVKIRNVYGELLGLLSKLSQALQTRSNTIQKLSKTIKNLKYNKTTPIGKQFHERLESMQQMPISEDVQQRLIEILEERSSITEEQLNVLEKIALSHFNPIILQTMLPHFAAGVPNMNMKNPQSYTIGYSGVSEIYINITKKP